MRFLILISAMFLTACGFHPVYGVNKYTPVGAETKLEQVSISNIPDREGQYLRNALIDRFYRSGQPASPQYNLSISAIRENRRELDVTIDSDTTRAQLNITVRIALKDRNTGKTLFERRIDSTASYNVLGSEYTNQVSEQNARQNVLDDVARQIEQQVTLYFKRTQ